MHTEKKDSEVLTAKEKGDLYLSDKCVKQISGWLSVQEFGELAGMKNIQGRKRQACLPL